MKSSRISNLVRSRSEGEDQDVPITRKNLADSVKGLIDTSVKNAVDPIRGDLSKLVEKLNKPPEPIVPPETKPDEKQKTPEQNADLLRLQNDNKTLTDKVKKIEEDKIKADERAAAADKANAIRQELEPYAFTSDKAKSTAYKLIDLDVQLVDGQYVANGLPLKDYVKNSLETENDYLLAKQDVSGSGNSRGVPQRGQVSMEMIRKGMPAAERAAVVDHIARIVNASQQ